MSSDNKNRSDDTKFSFAVRELRQARTSTQNLALDPGPKKTAISSQGFDPYNTSGGFDRTKNWTRVGKR